MKERGLYQKFKVERTDGSSAPGGKHDGCDYFVLDLTHDRHAVTALQTYAESCADSYPALYDDLIDKLAVLCKVHRRCTSIRKRGNDPDAECPKPPVIPLGNGCWFCVEHAVEWHRTRHALGVRAENALLRRGVPLRELLTEPHVLGKREEESRALYLAARSLHVKLRKASVPGLLAVAVGCAEISVFVENDTPDVLEATPAIWKNALVRMRVVGAARKPVDVRIGSSQQPAHDGGVR
ncbi:MAG: hypothetical protein ACHREM_00610 [Polyangiales bacterium]